jgi:ABC-type phosphate transport system substrate-binding protein
MLKRSRLLLLIIFGFFAFSGMLSAEGAFKIIVHSSNQTPSMTKEQASKLFLKKVTKWENGQPVLPIDLNATSPVRERFSKEIHGKTVTAIKSYWQQKIFTGRDVPPPEKQSDPEVLAYVEANANAIGYVADGSPVGNTKILKIID